MAIIITRDGTELKGAGNVTSISAESKKIVNLADPTANQERYTVELIATVHLQERSKQLF